MTMRDKIKEAIMMAQSVKNIANSLEFDAKDYDVHFPLKYVDELRRLSDNYLSLK